mmetsp:Transcript_41204/g.113664  ORF Transcript_41204/g.113664 Transcript_41204/m.113664 type:complete len:93 (-) Transcript_41204:242-520(-)
MWVPPTTHKPTAGKRNEAINSIFFGRPRRNRAMCTTCCATKNGGKSKAKKAPRPIQNATSGSAPSCVERTNGAQNAEIKENVKAYAPLTAAL